MTIKELKRKIERVESGRNINRYDCITEFSKKVAYLSDTIQPCTTYEESLKIIYKLLNKKFNQHFSGIIDKCSFEREIDYLFNSDNLLDIE